MTALPAPRLWQTTHPASDLELTHAPTLVGRQGVFTTSGDLCGYELLFRAEGLEGARADLWSAEDQDLATEHVIAAAFHQGVDINLSRDASVNFTGNFLLTHDDLHCDPSVVIIEVVESTPLLPHLIERLQELKAQGFRIALDDFMSTPAQCAILPLADFVKVDLRDLAEFGPSLVDQVRGGGRVLVAERVETQAELDMVIALGFDQVQGHFFQPAETLSVTPRDGGAAAG